MDYSKLSTEELIILKDQYQTDADLYGTSQLARKVLLNSLYGGLANEHFRFYRTKDAEAITISGQQAIKYLGRKISDYIGSIVGKTEQDLFYYYGDTDSCYFVIQDLVDKFSDKVPEDKMVDFLDGFIEKKVQPQINKTLDDLCSYMNTFQTSMGAKREAIFSSGIWTAKKRYALHVLDLEGTRFSKPKVKVTGIETQKSSTPEPVRNALMDALEILLSGTEDQLRTFVDEYMVEFQKLPLEQVAFPRGVNGIEKYTTSTGGPAKGCPIHVRAAIVYNTFVAKSNPDEYQEILSGDKMKYLHIKQPNPFGSAVFGFPEKAPNGFDIEKYVDWDMQFEKTFLGPLENLVEAVRWKLIEESNLEDFFS